MRLREAGLPTPVFAQHALAVEPKAIAGAIPFPSVVKPLALSGSRGVMRVNDEAELVAALYRLRALLAAPDIRAERDPAHDRVLIEQFIDGHEFAVEGVLTAIVLLSDGVTTVGSPVVVAAQQAAEEGVPISTIAFGTDSGSVRVRGEIIPVPADPDTMAQVAELTSGRFFEAFTADELKSVYEDIGTRVGYETTQRDASGGILAAGALALAGAFGLGLAWNGRLI